MRGLVAFGIFLIAAWLFGWLVFKVAGLLIHLLLIVGAIMLIAGLVRRARGGVAPTR